MRHDTYLQLLFALLRTVPEVSHPPLLQTPTLQERTLISCCHKANPPAAAAFSPCSPPSSSKQQGPWSFPLPSSAFLSHSTNFFICKMCIFIPLQDGFFAQNFSCKVYKSDVNRAKHQTAVSKEPCLAAFASFPRNVNVYLLVVPWDGWTYLRCE